ncbi:MAG: hypothetical protein ACQR33_04270 [Candidatus Saccharibacteria bacterium]
MDNPKQQVVERLQQANNILVTVSNNPSVDQLAACIGLTLALNKMGKHATAVFSGVIPSTIEFLQPERTLEKTTDSLRDFIIALDKSKADKLRYKVEDRMVKIFITPYRTSITDKDLDFSQGDFNVDVVLALGVHMQVDLDQAITSHGRILHDATVMTVNTKPGGELGSINWLDAGVSSLSELGVQMLDSLDKKLMDGQIATALLTGIVAETERFSNQKTSPQTMSISAELMSAGANQQLVATKLEEPIVVPQPSRPIAESQDRQSVKPREAMPAEAAAPKPNNDGTIEIAHDKSENVVLPPIEPPKQPESEPQDPVQPILPSPMSEPVMPEAPEEQAPQIHIDEQGHLRPFGNTMDANDTPTLPPIEPLPGITHDDRTRLLTGPEPSMLSNSPLTANSTPEGDDDEGPSVDPLSLPSVGLLNREPLPSQPFADAQAPTPPVVPGVQPFSNPMNPGMPAPSAIVTPSTPQQPVMVNPGVSPVSNFGENTNLSAPPANRTLSEIEQDVHSPHLENGVPSPSLPFSNPSQGPMVSPQPQVIAPTNQQNGAQPTAGQPMVNPASENMIPQNVDAARDAVADALNGAAGNTPEPIQALNAQPMSFGSLHTPEAPAMMPTPETVQPQQPVSYEPPTLQPVGGDLTTPPPVPPPMMPPTFPAQ